MEENVPRPVRSNSVSWATWQSVFGSHSLATCLRSQDQGHWGGLCPLDARPSHRRKDPVLLSFHLHLPLNWNFFILFQLFIWFLRDLTRQAVVSVKLLWQWGSHQTLFFFFFWQMRVSGLEYFRISLSVITCFSLLWSVFTKPGNL